MHSSLITCENYDNYRIYEDNNTSQRHAVEKKLKNGKTLENNITQELFINITLYYTKKYIIFILLFVRSSKTSS